MIAADSNTLSSVNGTTAILNHSTRWMQYDTYITDILC